MSKHVALLKTEKHLKTRSDVTINLRAQQGCQNLKLHQLTILVLIVCRH